MKKPSPATRRQLYLLGALAVLLILAVVKWGGKGSSAVPAPPARSTSQASGTSLPAGVEDDRPAAPRRAPRPSREKKASVEDVPFLTKEMLNPARPKSADAGQIGRAS